MNWATFLEKEDDAMMHIIDVTKPIYDALDIAVNYFQCKGEADIHLKRVLAEFICNMFNEGEQRVLILANRAIEMAERHLLVEQELRETMMRSSFHKSASGE
jgi:hypothetical protein